MAGTDSPARHILVIDDEVALLELLQEFLEEEGYRVTVVSVPPATEEIKRLGPDLILLDHRLGGGEDGWQVVLRLERDPETDAIPVVICTAAIHEAEQLGGELQARGIGVVLKPFDLDDLLAEITRGLAAKGATSSAVVQPEGEAPSR